MRMFNTNGSVAMQGMYSMGVKDSIWYYNNNSGKLEIKVMKKLMVI